MTREHQRLSSTAIVVEAVWLVSVAGVAGANVWLRTGALVPLIRLQGLDFILLARPLEDLIGWCALSLFALVAARLWLARIRRRLADRQSSERLRASVFSPLLLLAFPLLTVGLLATPLRRGAGPWLFLFLDLYPWLLLGVAALQIAALARAGIGTGLWGRLQGPVEIAARPRSTRWLEIALAAVLATSALASSPPYRFQSALIGDEPKYLRFDENWYQGHGLDISRLVPIKELPANYRPDLAGNLRHLATALASAASDFGADARRVLGLPAPARAAGATSQGGWFVDGKRGGVYQVHGPGLSLLLLPGYVIDRSLDSTADYHPQFPSNLYATNLTLLLLYVAWGVALFRLLLAHTTRPYVSWLVASIAMLSLPAIAFNYQYYPEAAAGLLLTWLLLHVTVVDDTAASRSFWHGVLAGFLPWLHLRFGLAPILVGLVNTIVKRRSPRAAIWLWVGTAVPLVALSIYTYQISGSLLPWALYAAVPDNPGFDQTRAFHDLSAFWLDRDWGLLALAPVYLLALPGLVRFFKIRPMVAFPLAVLILFVATASAGHGMSGGGTTPLRLVAAFVPLLAWPLAEVLPFYLRSRWLTAAFVVFSVVSIQTGFTYDRHFVKFDPLLRAEGAGGWTPSLLLPRLVDADYKWDPLFIGWALASVVLIALRFPSVWRPHRESPFSRWSWTVATAGVLAGFAGVGSVLGAYTGQPFDGRYLLDPGAARDRLVRTELTRGGGSTWSAAQGPIELTAVFPNPPNPVLVIDPAAPVARAGEPFNFKVIARGPAKELVWGRATIDFGDATAPVHQLLVGAEFVRHEYRAAGEFTLRVALSPPAASGAEQSATVRVLPR